MQTDGNAKERGSQNLGELHFDVFLMSVMNARKRIEHSFHTQVIRKLCEYNFGFDSLAPTISLGPMEQRQIDVMARVFSQLTGSSIVDPREPFIREMLGFPDMPDELKAQREQETVQAENAEADQMQKGKTATTEQ
jgi:hypothetical protein